MCSLNELACVLHYSHSITVILGFIMGCCLTSFWMINEDEE
jgi:hypothetical protein